MGIVLTDATKGFVSNGKRLPVLDRISISIADAEIVAVLGPSGCGKTTLLRLISGLETLDSGILTIAKAAAAKPVLGMIFQQPALLPWRTALENVLLPVELSEDFAADRSYVRSRAIDLLERMGLTDFAGYYPHQLSGGMRSRVAVARGLIKHPSILLLDEPFSALDEITRGGLQDLLAQIASELRLTIIFVTHSVDEGIVVADRVIVLSSRPATIVADVPVNLQRNARERRDSAAALGLRSQLREVLMRNAKPLEVQV